MLRSENRPIERPLLRTIARERKRSPRRENSKDKSTIRTNNSGAKSQMGAARVEQLLDEPHRFLENEEIKIHETKE